MTANKKSNNNLFKSIRERSYLNKDFDSFRNDLTNYARTYYPDKIQDFSETSLGGALVDLAAYVGDVMSFYLDHQFNELSLDTAVEFDNIQNLLLSSGIDIPSAAAAVVYVDFYIEVPAIISGNKLVPNVNVMPIIEKDTSVLSDNDIEFVLIEDVNFAQLNKAGELDVLITIGDTDAQNNPTTFILQKSGLCISGQFASEELTTGEFEAFKTYTLENSDVSQIVSVKDDFGNDYYEVNSLVQDTVFKGVANIDSDNIDVPENLNVIPAPYRFTTTREFLDRLTTLTFGGGDGTTLEDDIIPDPSQFSLLLYGKKINKQYSLDPNKLLNSNTFGSLQPNSTITIKYMYGGGLSHNVDARSINTINQLFISFPDDTTPLRQAEIRASLDVVNLEPARGGADPLSIEQLKALAPTARAAQNRIVTKDDLLGRIYTMPSNYGRVFRASIKSSKNNPFATRLYVATQNAQGNIDIAPDALKKNIRTYLNEYRLITDAIDILDTNVINLQIKFEILVDKHQNKRLILQDVLNKLVDYFDIKNFHIDQPISISDVKNIIYNTDSVVSLTMFEIKNLNGIISDRQYSTTFYNIEDSQYKGLLIPPNGSIFEVKFPFDDIIGTAI